MKIMILKRFLFISLTGCLLSFNLHSQSTLNLPQSTLPFLLIAPESRAGAMGDVGVATKPDAMSQHWNAAKYAFIPGDFGISLSFTPWLRNLVNDINLAYVTGHKRFDDRQVVSMSMLYFSLGEINFTDDDGFPAGSAEPKEFDFDVAYSRLFSEYFSSALTLRFIYSNITGTRQVSGQEYNPAVSFAADLSTYYQRETEIGGKPAEFAWGINISNLGTKVSYSEDKKMFIPTNLRLGARLTYDLDEYNNISIAADLNKLMVPTPRKRIIEGTDTTYLGYEEPTSLPLSWIQSFYDAPYGFKEEIKEIAYGLGLEYWYHDQFAIRAGYFHEHADKGNRKYFTAGVGIKLNVFSIDFSYLIPSVGGRNNPLANTMRFTLGLDFDKLKDFR